MNPQHRGAQTPAVQRRKRGCLRPDLRRMAKGHGPMVVEAVWHRLRNVGNPLEHWRRFVNT